MASRRASRPGSNPSSGQRWRNSWLAELERLGARTSAVVAASTAVSLMRLPGDVESGDQSSVGDEPGSGVEWSSLGLDAATTP